MGSDLDGLGIGDLQTRMDAGELTAVELAEHYLGRIDAIDRDGPTLRSVIETNPDALSIAERLDVERVKKGPRGPLHGIPILLKDNIDTADAMLTTAGSFALTDIRPRHDASVARALRDAGTVLLGKANLSEWANFRSTHSSSGWSGRGGQCRNPYALDRSPCGSSSGSAVAVAADLVPASIGTETDGSILCPAAMCGVVGIKPTVGLTSRVGVIPIAHSQDTVGPFARTVRDAAIILGALTGTDPRDAATAASAGRGHTDYRPFLREDGLSGARLGVAREVYAGYSEKADAVLEQGLDVMRGLGATIVDPADIPTASQMAEGSSEDVVLLYEFKADLNAYLAGRGGAVRSLEDLIAFNERQADLEMPYFGQERFVMAQAKGPLTDQAYRDALALSHTLSRDQGIDAVMNEHRLDALVMVSTQPAFKIDLINGDPDVKASSQPAAMAGYPAITVPAGFARELPMGLTFMSRAYEEPTLLRLAFAFEQAAPAFQAPKFTVET